MWLLRAPLTSTIVELPNARTERAHFLGNSPAQANYIWIGFPTAGGILRGLE
jgi:hypothetical protein